MLLTIKSVSFPQKDLYEGSHCIITYEDNSREVTISDVFYQRCNERGLSTAAIKAIPRVLSTPSQRADEIFEISMSVAKKAHSERTEKELKLRKELIEKYEKRLV